MKQKVTVKVAMECEKCRNKALKVASMIKGVSSVAIEGDSKDRVVVMGEDVDTVCLGRMLKNKFRCVTVLTVEEVKPPKKEDGKDKKVDQKEKEKEKEKEKKPKTCTVCVVAAHPCVCCCSPKCDGGCKHGGKCEGKCGEASGKCGGPCGKCESHKCDGGCTACFRCGSFRCYGHCASVICYGQCPPWLSCPSCCNRPPYVLCYSHTDEPSCSIQ